MADQVPTKTKVLIVDDDQVLCEMYAERLQAEGFETKTAFNGEEGVSKVVEFKPHCILLDLMMPKVDGFTALEILKSTPETKSIPVLILTALIQDENRKKGLAKGATDYIIKSETMPGEVVAKIMKAINGNKQQAPPPPAAPAA